MAPRERPRIESQARAVPGQLRGPAQVPHQVRTVALRIDALPDGGMRVSTTAARGWAMVARNPEQLARVVAMAFTEAQVATYARWKGAERYDLDELTEPQPGDPMAPERPRARRKRNTTEVGWGRHQRRPDAHDPADWARRPDGRWESPSGKTWPETHPVVQRVIARRAEFGLPND